ncbi:MAG TPA: bifunctional glutamate N-acetyltransferase/amino-acid acetyltransferase ArgJ [Clostridiaceae bacterium]|nr:bifunctional glutamate N-acetyltransferase/amino-acid acetyltransferase ArgJ [Clostridiaceae bacterium]
MKIIDQGVCAAQGFTASGIHAGIRNNSSKLDLALIVSEVEAEAAAVYTKNQVKAAPLYLTQENLSDGKARAIICNSGNANACTSDGEVIARQTCQLLADQLLIKPQDIIVASTGVIGQRLPLKPFSENLPKLIADLGNKSHLAAEAIMTTDLKLKEIAVSFEINGIECKIGGIAKGSGMIHPNMGTMLVFITTDCAISSKMLQKALSTDVEDTFNMVSVDGDTSTNDMVCILANGLAGNQKIVDEGPEYKIFTQALNSVTVYFSKMIAADGEGATKLLECIVTGATSKTDARKIAKSVISSSLVKAAFFGADANWGRILSAVGNSGAEVDLSDIQIALKSKQGEIVVCENGMGVDFSEELAKEILLEENITILITLNQGADSAIAWGCDLTYDYVKINGDYRT